MVDPPEIKLNILIIHKLSLQKHIVCAKTFVVQDLSKIYLFDNSKLSFSIYNFKYIFRSCLYILLYTLSNPKNKGRILRSLRKQGQFCTHDCHPHIRQDGTSLSLRAWNQVVGLGFSSKGTLQGYISNKFNNNNNKKPIAHMIGIYIKPTEQWISISLTNKISYG